MRRLLLEAQRLEQAHLFDLETLEAIGSCAGIENYPRDLTVVRRAAADLFEDPPRMRWL